MECVALDREIEIARDLDDQSQIVLPEPPSSNALDVEDSGNVPANEERNANLGVDIGNCCQEVQIDRDIFDQGRSPGSCHSSSNAAIDRNPVEDILVTNLVLECQKLIVERVQTDVRVAERFGYLFNNGLEQRRKIGIDRDCGSNLMEKLQFQRLSYDGFGRPVN